MSLLNIKRRKVDAGIDMTPLIDVVFQLLIFLMVSSHFSKPDKFVDLPTGQTKAQEVDTKIKKHTLTITAENILSLNGSEISIDQFDKVLKKTISDTQITRLEIRGDKSSNLGSFIDVIEKAKKAGIKSLSYHKKAMPIE